VIKSLLEDEIRIVVSNSKLVEKRSGWRRRVLEKKGNVYLSRVVSGHIPYFYRDPNKIASDFEEKYDALLNIADMMRTAPTTEKFRCSHFGEILSSIYIEQVLGYKILMRKLTQTTAENTNVHKMDIMCVDTTTTTFKYMWFEAKSSVRNGKVNHKSGIYKQMRSSLAKYSSGDLRFDIVKICDNLSESDFSAEERRKIKSDLKRPLQVSFQGIAVINDNTLSSVDDDSLLTEACPVSFDVRILVVSDLKRHAIEAFSRLDKIKALSEEGTDVLG
jgi:hypothetical protein